MLCCAFSFDCILMPRRVCMTTQCISTNWWTINTRNIILLFGFPQSSCKLGMFLAQTASDWICCRIILYPTWKQRIVPITVWPANFVFVLLFTFRNRFWCFLFQDTICWVWLASYRWEIPVQVSQFLSAARAPHVFGPWNGGTGCVGWRRHPATWLSRTLYRHLRKPQQGKLGK